MGRSSIIGGGDSQADTPDPIPNSEVKRLGGDNTSREDSLLPLFSWLRIHYLFHVKHGIYIYTEIVSVLS